MKPIRLDLLGILFVLVCAPVLVAQAVPLPPQPVDPSTTVTVSAFNPTSYLRTQYVLYGSSRPHQVVLALPGAPGIQSFEGFGASPRALVLPA